jgi:hypothetical protein
MKKRKGFVSNSSSSSFTVSQKCDWCEQEMPGGNPFPVVSNVMHFCSMECCNYHIAYQKLHADRLALKESKKTKPEPFVEVERFELMDFE